MLGIISFYVLCLIARVQPEFCRRRVGVVYFVRLFEWYFLSLWELGCKVLIIIRIVITLLFMKPSSALQIHKAESCATGDSEVSGK